MGGATLAEGSARDPQESRDANLPDKAAPEARRDELIRISPRRRARISLRTSRLDAALLERESSKTKSSAEEVEELPHSSTTASRRRRTHHRVSAVESSGRDHRSDSLLRRPPGPATSSGSDAMSITVLSTESPSVACATSRDPWSPLTYRAMPACPLARRVQVIVCGADERRVANRLRASVRRSAAAMLECSTVAELEFRRSLLNRRRFSRILFSSPRTSLDSRALATAWKSFLLATPRGQKKSDCFRYLCGLCSSMITASRTINPVHRRSPATSPAVITEAGLRTSAQLASLMLKRARKKADGEEGAWIVTLRWSPDPRESDLHPRGCGPEPDIARSLKAWTATVRPYCIER